MVFTVTKENIIPELLAKWGVPGYGKIYIAKSRKYKFLKPITDFERRHLQAAGALHETVGTSSAPITIHPGRYHTAPGEIMRILLEAGAKADKVVMGHLDRTIHDRNKLVEFGDLFKCYFEYDLFGIEVSHYQMDDTVFMPNDGERLSRIKVFTTFFLTGSGQNLTPEMIF